MTTASQAPTSPASGTGALLLRLGLGVNDGEFALRSGRPAGARVSAAAA